MTTFVTCSCTSCPSNSAKSCRAKRLSVGSSGECLAFGGAIDRSPTDNYVEIEGCACHRCDHWELDEATSRGKCSMASPLHFFNVPGKAPVCKDYKEQIGQPGFATNV